MKFTRSVLTLSAIFWLTLGTAEAEFIGLDISASQWSPTLGGNLNPGTGDSIDLVDDLDAEDSSQPSLVIILEHPIAALPNLRYQGYNPDSLGLSPLDSNPNFSGEAFASGDPVTSSFDLSQDDIVLYYKLLDDWVDLDLGVDLKRFDGEVLLSGETTSSVDVDETIPLLYLSARFDLPRNGFYVGANININSDLIDLGLSDSEAQDSTIMLGYESSSGLGVEGGYKYFSLDLDDVDSLDNDLEYDAIFLNGYYQF